MQPINRKNRQNRSKSPSNKSPDINKITAATIPEDFNFKPNQGNGFIALKMVDLTSINSDKEIQ